MDIKEENIEEVTPVVGEKGGIAQVIIETEDSILKPSAGALTKSVEMLWGLGTALIVIGLLGINHSLVFGMFGTTPLQDIMYVFAGISSIAIVITHHYIARIFGYAFLVLGLAGFVYPIGSFADSYLHLFFAFGFLYVYYSTYPERRDAFHLKPA